MPIWWDHILKGGLEMDYKKHAIHYWETNQVSSSKNSQQKL